jgi:hypothetical protein
MHEALGLILSTGGKKKKRKSERERKKKKRKQRTFRHLLTGIYTGKHLQ